MDPLVRKLAVRILLRSCACAVLGGIAGWLLAKEPLAGALAGAVVVLLWELSVQVRAAGQLSQLLDPDAWTGGAFSFTELPQQVSDLESRTVAAEQRLTTVLKALRNTARSFPDAALVLNDQGEVMVSNRPARRLLGVRRRLDKGRPARKLIDDPEFARWLKRGDKASVRFKSPVKAVCWLEAQRVPYAEKQFLLLVRDVTAAVLAEKARADFVANASHELQTPLTVLTGYLESMEDDKELTGRWGGPLKDMAVQCDRMTRLVRDLLELSRLESSETPPGFAPLDMAELLADAAWVVAARANSQLKIRVDLKSEQALLGDEAEIRSVATNLAMNAAAFTPSGGEIVLNWRAGGSGGRLAVSDTGIGIKPEHFPRLTERFYRVRGEGSPAVVGTGLGLAIVKHVLTRHDGSLEIESELGVGSTFTCVFPAKRIGE